MSSQAGRAAAVSLPVVSVPVVSVVSSVPDVEVPDVELEVEPPQPASRSNVQRAIVRIAAI